ncbi:phage virion morphogenesis protein [Sphingobium sp. BYY-5]|uniref:phage virion morphogenesis protein n=1 Tax=Sphingobium sp. BYY-5 TaxID=2926400 RepID=UPI001FA7263D|nr:phage virion morphogenesis protein [Sphingobium sp. BYY-5]MCI4588617.1 phage virion morphogenesis protein [Sphingobium sp. BYY-5]
MTDDLTEIERIAGALLRTLSSGERRALMRRMARSLASSQRERVAAQRQPDGAAFEARKEKQPPMTGRGAACFLYPSSGGGGPRKVVMKSFTWAPGRMMTGFDIEAGAIRSFAFDKIVKWLPVPQEHRSAGGSSLRRRGGIRRKAMLRRLASARFLRSGTDDQGFWIGFSGKASQIAGVHQYGLRDKPSLRAQAVPYPKRELLGATAANREHLLDLLYTHIAEG